jgi:ABC-type transport system substrate-binding protein
VDEIYGRYIESPAAQLFALETDEVDYWPDIRDPQIIRDLEDDGYNVVFTPEAFMYYHIDFNVRDQIGNGTHVQCSDDALGNPTYAALWRGPTGTQAYREANYYTYTGARYQGYVPLDDFVFRYAVAHCLPLEEIVATVYGGISAAPINSIVPEAQKYWHNPDATMPPYALGDPTATTEWNPATGANDDACSVLRYGGYAWDPEADNPAPKHSGTDPDGNWIDPMTGEPMNHILFAGVTEAIAPDSHGRDDLCARDMRAIGLPIELEETDYGYLTDTMMDFFQFDMYALGWSIGRNPDHLIDFFHSDKNTCPEGYNIMGAMDSELDALLDIIEGSMDRTVVRTAAFDAQVILNSKCYSLPTVTRPLTDAGAQVGDTSGSTDTIKGVVNSPGYGPTTSATKTNWYWASNVGTGNPYGIGGTIRMVLPSEATNYHPAFASTTDEWLIMDLILEGLIGIDPWTHDDIPNVAEDWTVEAWTPDAYTTGVNVTFWLRDDVYWHDGVHVDADEVKFSWDYVAGEYPPFPPVGRAGAFWEDYEGSEVWGTYCLSVYQNKTSMFTLYDCAGWTPLFPQHIYEGEDEYFRPEATPHPDSGLAAAGLKCLLGTGPFVFIESTMVLGGYCQIVAFRPGVAPHPTAHWWQSVEGFVAELTEQFHWIGDVSSLTPLEEDGIINIYDMSTAGKAYGKTSGQPGYEAQADIAPEATYHNNDGRVDIRDIAEIGKNWGKQRSYP